MEDGSITDDQITASSEYNQNHGSRNARLNRSQIRPRTGAWSAKTNDLNQWIQVDLGGLKIVSGVITQGRNGENRQWVSKFSVQYSINSDTWINVEDGSSRKVRKQAYDDS